MLAPGVWSADTFEELRMAISFIPGLYSYEPGVWKMLPVEIVKEASSPLLMGASRTLASRLSGEASGDIPIARMRPEGWSMGRSFCVEGSKTAETVVGSFQKRKECSVKVSCADDEGVAGSVMIFPVVIDALSLMPTPRPRSCRCC